MLISIQLITEYQTRYRSRHLLYVKKFKDTITLVGTALSPYLFGIKGAKNTENILLLAGTETNILDESQV